LKSKHQTYSARREIQAKNKQENKKNIQNEAEDRLARSDCSFEETLNDCCESFEDFEQKHEKFTAKIRCLHLHFPCIHSYHYSHVPDNIHADESGLCVSTYLHFMHQQLSVKGEFLYLRNRTSR
jgi:hypothetical protein